MKLRNYTLYYNNDQESPTVLQYWDEEDGYWKDIEHVRTSYKNDVEARRDKNYT